MGTQKRKLKKQDKKHVHSEKKSEISIKIKKKTIKKAFKILGAIIILALAVMGIKSFVQSGTSEKIKLDFYVMSQCPYGTQVEDAIAPVLEKMGTNIDFNLNFISTDLGDGTFRSLHGEPETQGNIVQLCAIKYEPEDYMNMIVCMNKNAGAIPSNWETCAKENKLDVDKIKTCFEGDEGKQLLSKSIEETNKVGATGSPTIYLNDQPYAGGRTEGDFLRALCNTFEGKKPKACSEIPEPVKVKMIVLNDERCKSCDVTRLIAQLKSLFPGLDVEYLDYMDKEGKKLYDEIGITLLPALLFDESVENGEGYSNVQRYLQPAGDYQRLLIGADFDPTKEICDNKIDDNNNGKIDCDDSDCDGEFLCMEKRDVPKVELFVMSHCPYGTQTEKGFLPVIELLGGKIDFEVKFVDYAMHGKTEIDEELLQYCIQSEQNDLFIPYLKCFLEEGNTDECVAEVEVDETKLDSCIEATDKKYRVTELYNDQSTWSGGSYPQFNIYKAENDKYGIAGSPSLAVNDVVVESFARDPASLLDVVCLGFEDKPSECDEQLSTQTPSAGFGFGTATSGSSQGSC